MSVVGVALIVGLYYLWLHRNDDHPIIRKLCCLHPTATAGKDQPAGPDDVQLHIRNAAGDELHIRHVEETTKIESQNAVLAAEVEALRENAALHDEIQRLRAQAQTRA